jgi:hypothetical protein
MSCMDEVFGKDNLGPQEGTADVEALRGADVIVRIEPGDIRV